MSMDSDLSYQKLANLTCSIHNKRIQLFCTADSCEKTFICADCLVIDKAHVAIHLDGFCSTEDYRNKVVTNLFQRFTEALSKVTNLQGEINNSVEELATSLQKEVSMVQDRTVGMIVDFFDSLKVKMSGLARQKYHNFEKSLEELRAELEKTRENSIEFLENLRQVLSENSSNNQIAEQIRFFNDKRHFDRSLLGRVENITNFINENAKINQTRNSAQHIFKINGVAFEALSNEIATKTKEFLDNAMEDNNLIKDIIAKPPFSINRLSLSYLTIPEISKFNDVQHLERLNAFDMTSHPSVRILATLLVENKYIFLGSSDQKYRGYFINSAKMSKNLKSMIKGESPFTCIIETEQGFHSGYVTALESVKVAPGIFIIVSGDATGACKVMEYELNNDRLIRQKHIITLQPMEFKVIQISYLPNIDYISVGDAKSTIGFWDIEDWKLKDVVRTEEETNMVNYAFASNFSYLCLITDEGDLTIWKIKYTQRKEGGQNKLHTLFDTQNVEIASIQKHISLIFSQDKINRKTFNIFTTNYRGDHMLFISDGFCIKVVSAHDGWTVSQVDGAHYKGISSMFFIVNTSTEGQIYSNLNMIDNGLLSGPNTSSQDVGEFFGNLLDCYKLVTLSSKEHIRLWKFKDFEAKLLDQDIHPGGGVGRLIFNFQNNKGDNFLITSGNTSNKIIIYALS